MWSLSSPGENGLEGEEEMGGGAAKRAQLETSEDLGLAAARDGQLEELHRLVAAGWDPLVAVDRHGSSALHFAAGAGHLEVSPANPISHCGPGVAWA